MNGFEKAREKVRKANKCCDKCEWLDKLEGEKMKKEIFVSRDKEGKIDRVEELEVDEEEEAKADLIKKYGDD